MLKQFSIIFSIYFLGELAQKMFGLPVPGNVIGMLLLFFCLYTGIIKLEMIEKASGFLLNNLAFFFLPAGVSLITCYSLLEGKWTEVLIITLVSTLVILVVTGLVVQLVQKCLSGASKDSACTGKKEFTVGKDAVKASGTGARLKEQVN